MALGYRAFPTKADVDTTIAEVVAKYGAEVGARSSKRRSAHVKIAGRIMAVREFGKTAFLVLSEKTARIQVYCRKDTLSGARVGAVQEPRRRRLDLGRGRRSSARRRTSCR